MEESTKEYNDDFVKKLQQTILKVKKSREMGVRYMAWHEMLREEWNDGRKEGRIEAILELLEDLGDIPEELQKKIEEQKDELLDFIKEKLKQAIKDFVASKVNR